MAFAFNATPMTDDVEIDSWISILFFILTLTNLFFSAINYNLITNGLRSILNAWRFIILLYGLAVFIIGIVILADGLQNTDANSKTKWATLSSNQQDYFRSLSDFKATRKLLIELFGSFIMVIGFLQLASFYFCH